MPVCPNCNQRAFSGDIYCGGCGSLLPTPTSPQLVRLSTKACPKCRHTYEPSDLFCEFDGTPLPVATTPSISGPPVNGPVGILVMPDQSEVTIQQPRRVFGRRDLNKFLKPENVKEVSRVHFTIIQQNGEFYLQDGGPDPKNAQTWKGSVNGTTVNGAPLEPSVKQRLNTNDVIDVSKLGINLTFKTR